MLLDPGSGCTSPLSIDGVAFGVVTWSTSRFSTVQVGQTVLDRYTRLLDRCYALTGRSSRLEVSLSGVGSGLSALATCDADVW